MFRLWAKEFKSNRMIRDMVVENDSPEMSRTKKVFAALEEVCYEFDLSKPIWLETISKNSSVSTKPAFAAIILSTASNLIILRSTLLRKIRDRLDTPL